MIFRNWVLQNFPFLEDDFDALTDYELFSKVVEYMRESLEHIKTYDGILSEFNTRLTELENYINNLDLQDEVNKKLDEMVLDGTLTDLVAQIFDTLEYEINGLRHDMQEADTTLSNSITSTNNNLTNYINTTNTALRNDLNSSINYQGTLIEQNSDDIATLTTRVNNIANLPSGSTSGDAELIDGRTGYNGVTYNNIGTAIRTQVSNIHKALNIYHVDLVDAKNGSNGNPANPNAISFATVQPINNTSVKVKFNIADSALTDVEYLKVTLAIYKVTSGVTTDNSNRLEEFENVFIVNPYDYIIIDKNQYFTRRYELTQPVGFSCSIQAYDDTDTVVPLRIADTGTNIISIEKSPFESYYSYRAVDEDIKAVYPLMRNGSMGNTANLNAVSCANIIPISTNTIRIVYQPNEEADHYLFAVRRYSISQGGVIDANIPYILSEEEVPSNKNYIDYKVKNSSSAVGYAVCVWCLNSSDQVIPQRVGSGKLKFLSYSNIPETLQELKDTIAGDNILTRNNDVLPNVIACANGGINGGGDVNIRKKYTLLFTTDLHGVEKTFSNAIEYLNNISYIDAGVCMGDIVPSNYSQSATYFTNLVNESNKNFYTILGNHDLGNGTDGDTNGTVAEAFTKYIYPTIDKIGEEIDKPYYRIDNEDYKISMIFLNNYDVPNDKIGDDFIVSRGDEIISSTQINWLLSQLDDIPSDYTLAVIMHSFPYDNELIESNFTQTNFTYISGNSIACYTNIIPDIINAWINKTSLVKSYTPQLNYGILPTININHSFSNRTESHFACYFVGHQHADAIARSSTYNNQKIICLCATAYDNYQNYGSDLPRVVNTKTYDAITVATIDTENHRIKLARVGSNKTINMIDRSMISISY